MNIRESIKSIKNHTSDILSQRLETARKPVNGHTSYVCPICGHGKGGDGLTVIPAAKGNTGTTLKCFGCNFTGSVIDLTMKSENVGLIEAVQTLGSLIGVTVDVKEQSIYADQTRSGVDQDNRTKEQDEAQQTQRPDFSEYYKQTREYMLNSPAAFEYLNSRGIDIDTLLTCQFVGFDPQADPANSGHPFPRLLFYKPDLSHYNTRAIQSGSLQPLPKEYTKLKPAGVAERGFFGAEWLNDNTVKDVFVCEGEIDALSYLQCGCAAVALSSYSRCKDLSEYIIRNGIRKRYIVSLDNDPNGRTYQAVRQAEKNLIKGLNQAGYAAISYPISGRYKDVNEALTAEPAELRKRIRNALEAVKRADRATAGADIEGMTPEQYKRLCIASESMIDIFSDSEQYKTISTGFRRLDSLLSGGLYEGLYVIGGLPSLGKTTFTMQICDQIAKAGNDVLIFSLEMSRKQLISKSISRETHEYIERNQLSVSYASQYLQILKRENTGTAIDREIRQRVTDSAMKAYAGYANHISIYQSVMSVTPETIREVIEAHLRAIGNTPVIIVDYLQIMGANGNCRTDKERIDRNVSALKRISNDYGVPVIAVASVNRDSYEKKIKLSSFKESGGIEYGADVVIGLQFTDAENKIENEEDDYLRRITAVVLKNRFGIAGEKANADYVFYKRFNRFKEVNA